MLQRRICFEFNEEKATAAASLLLRRHGGRMSYMKLLKLLYIAERESLRKYGRPICGDDYYSMKFGPVMGIVYNLIKEDQVKEDFWFRHIRREPGTYDVSLIADPSTVALSQAEIRLLDEIFENYKQVDQWDLSGLTHEFPEWEDPGDSCRKIPPERILRALGKSDEEIDEIAQETQERSYFEGLFQG